MFDREVRPRDVALVGAILLVGSLIPVPFGRRPSFERYGPDKLLHFLGHAAFAAALAEVLAADDRDGAATALLAVGASTGHGVVTGYLQRWVPGRRGEAADVFAGFLGSVAAVAVRTRQRDTDGQ